MGTRKVGFGRTRQWTGSYTSRLQPEAGWGSQDSEADYWQPDSARLRTRVVSPIIQRSLYTLQYRPTASGSR